MKVYPVDKMVEWRGIRRSTGFAVRVLGEVVGYYKGMMVMRLELARGCLTHAVRFAPDDVEFYSSAAFAVEAMQKEGQA